MEKGTRTMAFQMPEEMFQRLKTSASCRSASSSVRRIRFSTNSFWVSFLPVRALSRSR